MVPTKAATSILIVNDEDQSKFLDMARKKVKEHAFYMKRAIDGDKLDVALEQAVEMVKELKMNV